MDEKQIESIINHHIEGKISLAEAISKIKNLSYENVGFARIDHARRKRQGFPEVIFGQGKTKEQISVIFQKLAESAPNVLVTRTNFETYEEIKKEFSEAEWHEQAKLIRLLRDKTDLGVGEICVVTAGTSDIPIAEEAALTAEAMGNRVCRIWDAGVAGIHRILSEKETLCRARVVVVVAGMEGALPSVVGGLVSVPVIAVPTSIGYGASFQGLAALLGMLNSCASNVTVVNIDNGFGAGFVASLINRKWKKP
jgi:NCAIR mutase (PurE)-related protein